MDVLLLIRGLVNNKESLMLHVYRLVVCMYLIARRVFALCSEKILQRPATGASTLIFMIVLSWTSKNKCNTLAHISIQNFRKKGYLFYSLFFVFVLCHLCILMHKHYAHTWRFALMLQFCFSLLLLLLRFFICFFSYISAYSCVQEYVYYVFKNR